MAHHVGFMLFVITGVLVALTSFLARRKNTLSHYRLRNRSVPGQVSLNAAAERSRSAGNSLWMPVAVSLVVLLAALYIILSKQYEVDQQKWAFGVIGTVLGYWLKT